MTLHEEILIQVRRCLAGDSAIGEFSEWFFPATWNVHRSGDAEAVRLRGKIALALAEFDRGHRTEDELRRQLADVLADAEASGRRAVAASD